METGSNSFIIFGGLLVAGLVGGHLASRTPYLPRITGMIAVGMLIGPSGLELLSEPMLKSAGVFVDLALGLILFQLGLMLDLRGLAANRPTQYASLLEASLSFVLIGAALMLIDVPPLSAALIAAIGVSSSPAVLLMVTRELDAEGPVTDNALKLVALNNVIAFLIYSLILPLVHREHDVGWWLSVTQPFLQLAGALLLAWGMAKALIWLAHWTLSPHSDSFSLVVGFVLLTLGFSRFLDLPPILALLALGIILRNLETPQGLVEVNFGRGGEIFFLILFVIAGASLHLNELVVAGGAAATFVLARFAGKGLGVFIALKTAGLTSRQASATGFTLLPMAGLAIGLTQSTQALYPAFGANLAAIVLAAVAILETLGPIATEYALKWTGEVHPEKAADH